MRFSKPLGCKLHQERWELTVCLTHRTNQTDTLGLGFKQCFFLILLFFFSCSVLKESYFFNMARTKERDEVRPRLRESRSASVLTSHTSQARTAFPQPAGSSLSSLITRSLQTVLAAASLPRAAHTAMHTTARPQGLAAAQAEGANAGRKCKGTWEICLGCFCLISLSQPNLATPRCPSF